MLVFSSLPAAFAAPLPVPLPAAFDDEDQHYNDDLSKLVTVGNARLIEDATLEKDGKYLAIKNLDNNMVYAQGYLGEEPTFENPISPSEGCGIVIEFTLEQTQDIRLELWNEDNTEYLGLMAFGEAQGQWGVYEGDKWYPSPVGTQWGDYFGMPWYPNGTGIQKPVATAFIWNGKYFNHDMGEIIFPGQEGGAELEEDGQYVFYVRFQPVHPKNVGYYISVKIIISYSPEDIMAIMDMRNPFLDGDPVSMVNGNFTWDYTDFAVYGAQNLEFIRHYNAIDKNESEVGYGWRHNYLYSVDKTMLFATLNLPNGNSVVYNIKGDGSFEGPKGKDYKLEADGSGFVMTDQAMTKYYFNGDGNLIAIEDVGGMRTEITRNGDEIATISNNSGTLTFSYSGGKISKIADQTGRSVFYTYNGGDLVSFLNADNDTIDYKYDDHKLTEISDFNNDTYLKNVYDDHGRVI
ncbi:MAG: DUF6531 domain-containing protein, partial [Prevotellaceae bacterium]|nr:DUF6531 domain-containing protein [Prevotellaceae bacterium]